MAIDLERFRDAFFQEAFEHLAELEAGLLRLEHAGTDSELLNSIFRGAHSIKGGAGTFGLDGTTRFTHVLESLLDRLRSGGIGVSRELTDLLLRAVDVLRQTLEAARAGGDDSELPEGAGAVLGEMTARCGVPEQAPPEEPSEPDAAPTEAVYQIRFEPGPELFRTGLDPLLVLRDLAQLGELLEVSAGVERLPALAELDPEVCHLAWKLRLHTTASIAAIRDVFAFVEDVAVVEIAAENAPEHTPQNAPATAAPPQPARSAASQGKPAGSASIRVPTEKVDQIINLVGELVIAQSMATQVMNNFTEARLGDLQVAVSELERYTRELQERVMRVRMLPIGTIFGRFPRLVRDTAAALGKQAALEMSGEDTEMDKGVVERIADPLMHLIRNAVDHGIETGADRMAAGKPEQGVIRLAASHQGGNVVIEISDDGRGLDARRIRAKAIERGLLGPEAELSDEQAVSIIFEPGFSTAATVSDLSGRGVGMDVVRKNVDALNGAVGVTSSPGRGTTVRIKLPLTLAILDGLCLRIGEQKFILPLAAIVESIRPLPGAVKTVAGRGETVLVRGEPVAMLRLHALFHVPDAETDPNQALLVIVEHEGRRLALLVDELLGQQQVVIKSLETHYRKVDGITGATILGDGRAALILDVAGIAQMARHANPREPAPAAA